ncbi:MAG: hypothetical protein H3C51_04455 [Rubellimicrobium sp.]|nr:hypothetical protein [Rubellimicrobium sp.]
MRLQSLACAASIAVASFLATTASADNFDRHVIVTNNTGRVIWAIHGSRSDTNSWEEDILGDNVLPDGDSANINFDDGTGACQFDVKVVFPEGDSIEEYNIDVCSVGTLTVE